MARPQAILTLAAIGAFGLTSAATPHGFPRCTHSRFEGITQTTSDGTIVGEPDARDWGCVGGAAGADAIRALPRGRTAPLGLALGPPAPPPTAVCMDPAAPNPADQATRLQFGLPASAHVNLSVYGRRQGHGPRETFVARALVDAEMAAGLHAVYWDLTDEHGVRVAAGIYRAVLVVGDDTLCGDIEVR